MRGYVIILGAVAALLALYLFLTLDGREYFDASTRPKNSSIWQDSSGGFTAYWEPPDTDNTYSFKLEMNDRNLYSVGPSNKAYQTYNFGQRDIGFGGAVELTDVTTNKTSSQVEMKHITEAAGKALINAASGAPSTNVAIPTPPPAAASTTTTTTTPTSASSSTTAPRIQNANVVIPNTAPAALGTSSLISGVAGLLLNPDASTIITTGQIPIGDVGQDSQIYEYNNGYAAFAASANLFGDSINNIKTDMQSSGNEYNVSVISDNGINYTFPLDQITSVTSSTNGGVVAYNLLNTTHPKGNNMFTGNGARTIGIEITLVGPSGTSGAAATGSGSSSLTSAITTPAPPTAVAVGSTLNAPTNAPTYGPAGLGVGGCSINGTIPPLSPYVNSGSGSGSGQSNIVPKSSLVPCSCATTGSASCSTHQGSTCSSTVPGQPCSSLTDPADTISSLTKAQRQWDLMKPFNTIMGDVPGYLNSFSAFG
jgi:hypothetical protein